jgi:hypothetical protein
VNQDGFSSNKQKQDAALPLTKDTAKQHILGANYQTLIWENATHPFPTVGDPSDNG